MTQQIDLWKGPFGDLYQERNHVTADDIEARAMLWEVILKIVYGHTNYLPNSMLEVGAGQGPNLLGIQRVSMKIGKPIKLYATEINEKARLILQENVKDVELLANIPKQETVDLVYTYGVLIHTHPAHVRGLMTEMFNASSRFIVCCEYFSPELRPIVYRGEKDALWLNDYGKLWLDSFPLRILHYGFCWKPLTGLDNITYWVFEKTRKMI